LLKCLPVRQVETKAGDGERAARGGGSSSPLLRTNNGGEDAKLQHRPTERPIHLAQLLMRPVLAFLPVDTGTLYLIIGAALICGACAYAAKRIPRQLTMKQVRLISVLTFIPGRDLGISGVQLTATRAYPAES
jgi:hypothetical protein